MVPAISFYDLAGAILPRVQNPRLLQPAPEADGRSGPFLEAIKRGLPDKSVQKRSAAPGLGGRWRVG